MLAAVTVLARNYVPRARVLAASFAEQHPDGRLVAVVVDAEADVPGAEVVGPAWLGIDPTELHTRAALYDRQGVAASMTWPALRTLLDEGAEVAVLLDPDMLLLAPIGDIADLARAHGIVLSPHGLPADRDVARTILAGGTYNGGFLAVAQAGRPFLEWMAKRMRRDCLRDSGLFYGQPLLDLVPEMFGAHVLRDAGVNAMPDDFRGRDLDWSSGRPAIGDTPLRLAHLAGYAPARPHELCRYYPGDAAMQLAGRPGLQRLYGDYDERLRAAGHPASEGWRWARTAAGPPYDDVMRHVFSAALRAAETSGTAPPPDPFDDHHPEAFPDWLAEPAGLSRYLAALHAMRSDLQLAFPAVPGADEAAYLGWARETAGREFPSALSPT